MQRKRKGENLKMHTIGIGNLKPYKNNPRKNDEAVDYVANSIQEFGFKVPLVVDGKNNIVCGHTRYKAAIKLGLEEVPCIVADDLSKEQIKAFRLADNKTGEIAFWDFDLLKSELSELGDVLDMNSFGFLDNSVSYIDDLAEDSFSSIGDGSLELDTFDVSFTFDNKHKSMMDAYLKEFGKKQLVKEILKFIKSERR